MASSLLPLRNERPRRDGAKIGFVVGKYFELGADKRPDFNGIDRNITDAVAWGRKLFRAGFPVFIPHLNTYHFEMRTRIDPDPLKNEEFYRAFDRRLLSEGMDFVFATPNWRNSSGGRLEVQLACHLGIPVFETIEDLCAWAEGRDDHACVTYDEIAEEAKNFGSADVPIVIVAGPHLERVSDPESRILIAATGTIDSELDAERAAVDLFNNRIAAFTPQMNDSYRRLGLGQLLHERVLFTKLNRAILERVADAVYCLDDWEDAADTRFVREHLAAADLGNVPAKPLFTSLDELIAWRDTAFAARGGASK